MDYISRTFKNVWGSTETLETTIKAMSAITVNCNENTQNQQNKSL